MNETKSIAALAKKIRLHALAMTNRAGSAHIGSVFSCADILAVLYDSILNVNPAYPNDPLRDRFIMSKGHAGAGVYAALAERDFFPVEKLTTYCQNGSDLSGHISHHNVPGVEFSTGSLGHGLPVASGMAYAAKLLARKNHVFVLLSDGECDEGSNWEAALFSAHHQLDNLVAIIDYNKIQSLNWVEKTIRLEPFVEKWRSFGWLVEEVDGHNYETLEFILKKTKFVANAPQCIIAHTVKGKGVSFMENSVLWHYRTAKGDEFKKASEELQGT